MKVFKTKDFAGFKSAKELAQFVNERNIKKEDIVAITQYASLYVIFYYEEE